MNTKKKQTLFIAFLLTILVGIGTSFFAVHKNVDIRNRAAGPECSQLQGKCTVAGTVGLIVSEIGADGKPVTPPVAFGRGPEVFFLAEAGKQYRCDIVVDNASGASLCPNSSDIKSPNIICQEPTVVPTKPDGQIPTTAASPTPIETPNPSISVTQTPSGTITPTNSPTPSRDSSPTPGPSITNIPSTTQVTTIPTNSCPNAALNVHIDCLNCSQ